MMRDFSTRHLAPVARHLAPGTWHLGIFGLIVALGVVASGGLAGSQAAQLPAAVPGPVPTPVVPLPLPALAPGQTLPAAQDLFARHVQAMGGEAAFKAVHSMHALGRFAIAAQGIGGQLALFSARPARMVYRVTIPGIGRIENGYDGRIGWSISPVSGPELLKGRQLLDAADDAWFDAPLHGPDHVQSAQTLARVQFDGRPAYKVRVVLRSGREQTEYFDADAGFQIGSEAVRATSQGDVPTVNVLRDYRKFGDIMLATTFLQRALGFEQVVTIVSCIFDDVPDSTFEAPASVKALVGP
jgi:hypothetical protein